MAEKVRTFKREFKIVEASHGGDDSQIVIQKDLKSYVKKSELIDNLSTKKQQNAFAREIVNAAFKSRIWKQLETKVNENSEKIDENSRKLDRLEIGQQELRTEMLKMNEKTNSRIDETNSRIDETNAKLDETNAKLDEVLTLLKSR